MRMWLIEKLLPKDWYLMHKDALAKLQEPVYMLIEEESEEMEYVYKAIVDTIH